MATQRGPAFWTHAVCVAVAIGAALLCFALSASIADAATRTWDGGSVSTQDWSDCTNWSDDTCPVSGDTVTFDSTSVEDATVDASFGGTVAVLNINSGYTGTTTLARALTVTTYSQAAGGFDLGSQTLTMSGSFTISAGNFAQSTGTVAFRGLNSTINVPVTETFYNVDFNTSQAGWGITITSGDTLVVTNQVRFVEGFVNTGTVDIQGAMVYASSTADGGSGVVSFTQAGNETIQCDNNALIPGLLINKSSGTLSFNCANLTTGTGPFTLQAGTFSLGSNTLKVQANFTTSGGTFDEGTGTIVFHGNSSTINVPVTETFYNVDFNTISAGFGITITSGDTLVVTNLLRLIEGTVGTGDLRAQGDVTVSSTFDGGTSPLTFSGSNTQSFDLTGATGNFNADITVNKSGGQVNLLSALVMDAASQDLNITLGTFDLNGQNLTVSGSSHIFSVSGGGNLQLQGGETVSGGPTVLRGGSTITYDGTGTYSSLAATSTYQHLSFTGSGSWTTSTALTINENFTQTAGTFTSSATTTFASATSSTVTTSAGTTFSNIKINKTATSTFLAGNLSLGSLEIAAGTLDATAAGCSGSSCGITLSGNWYNTGGTFTPRTSTVTFNGSGQRIVGANTFYNLTKITGSTDTFTFPASATQTVQGTWTAQGAASNALSLRSSIADTQWRIDPQAGRTIAYLDVKDSNNINATAVDARGTNSVTSGNNTNWTFNAAPSDPSSLGPTAYVNGSWGSDSTPSLTFTTADGDGDTVQYQIQIDDTAGFGSPVVDYTSALAAAGASTFTVGQAVGSGTYTTGSSGQTLADGSYYWRVRAGDTSYATSSYSTANSGAIAFRVDTTAPTAGTIALSATTTSSVTVTISGASDAGSGLGSTPYLFFESSTASSTGQTSSTTWSPAGLIPNTQYTFTVGVSDGAGNVATTSAQSGYTLAAAPASASATGDSTTQITLAWGAGSNPGSTQYYAENTTAATNSGWVAATTWVETGLTAGTTYAYTVKARNGDGVETTTASASAATQAAAIGGGIVGNGAPVGSSGPMLEIIDVFATNARMSLLVGPARTDKGEITMLIVEARNFYQATRNVGGDVVAITVSGANAAFPQVIDNKDGTYTAQYFAANAGADTVTATINGKKIGQDSDGESDGNLHVLVVAKDQPKPPSKPAGKPASPPGQVNKPDTLVAVAPTLPAPEPPKKPTSQSLTIEYGLTGSCMRAFTWSDGNGSVRIYRTIGGGHETQVATINQKTPWYIDVDPITGASLTYRFDFVQAQKSVTFSAAQLSACANSQSVAAGTPSGGGAETPPQGVIEQDVDGDGNPEQLIGEVFQDTDGSSVPLAVLGEAILVDTDDDGEPDVLWDPPQGVSKVIVAGDRLYIPGSSITDVHSYQSGVTNRYLVFITNLLGGGVALAVDATQLDENAIEKDLGVVPPPPVPETLQTIVTASSIAAGLALIVPASFGFPFSIGDLGRLFFHFSNGLFTIFATRKRKRPWGTVYDSLTKEPLDPAYVELIRPDGRVIASAITDLDGRYGFLVAPGSYHLRARKTHYEFPSQRQQGLQQDILYSDLYFGDEILVGADGAVTRNIPMDQTGVDWNQVAKRSLHITTFVHSFDRYLLAFLDLVFLVGFVLVGWKFLSDMNAQTISLVLLYALLLAFRLFVRRPRLYGFVGSATGVPLSYGILRFQTLEGHEVAAKVLDDRGRYMALLAPGTYRYVVERRVDKEVTERVHDGMIRTKNGVVNEGIVVG